MRGESSHVRRVPFSVLFLTMFAFGKERVGISLVSSNHVNTADKYGDGFPGTAMSASLPVIREAYI